MATVLPGAPEDLPMAEALPMGTALDVEQGGGGGDAKVAPAPAAVQGSAIEAKPLPMGGAVGADGIPEGFPVFDENATNAAPSLTAAPTPHVDTSSHADEQTFQLLLDVGAWVCLLVGAVGVIPYGFLIFAGVGVLSLLLGVCSDTANYLDNPLVGTSLADVVNNLKETVPTLVVWGRAHHTEQRTRQVRNADGKGTHTEHYTVDVTTHSASVELKVDGWEDASPLLPVDELSKHELLQLTMGAVWRADDATRSAIGQFQAEFDSHHNRDKRYSSGINLKLPGLRGKLLCVNTPGGEAPWWLGLRCFRLATVLNLSSAYKMYFDDKSARLAYCFEKHVTAGPGTLGSGRVG